MYGIFYGVHGNFYRVYGIFYGLYKIFYGVYANDTNDANIDNFITFTRTCAHTQVRKEF